MEYKRNFSTAGDSVIEKSDECNSMYFSFNSTAIESDDKTLEGEEFVTNIDCSGDTTGNFLSIISTVKKTDDCSIRALPKNILTDCNIHSSTPTKYFSPRPALEGNNAALGVSMLPITYIDSPENKENVINSDKSPSTSTVSEIDLQLERLKICNEKAINKSRVKENKSKVLPENNLLKESQIIRKPLLKYNADVDKSTKLSIVRKKLLLNEPDLSKNRPSRISLKKSSGIINKVESPVNICKNLVINNPEVVNKNVTKPGKGKYFENLANSTESSKHKIEKRRTIYAAYTFPIRKSVVNRESINTEDHNINKRQPRYSVSKTTLNSPGIINKKIRRTLHKPFIKNDIRKTIVQTKILLNSPTKLKSNIIDNNKNGSSTVKASSLTSKQIQKQKVERKISPIIRLETPKEIPGLSSNETHEQNKKSNEYICKYCDKKFAISKALQIHLLQNCLKISSTARKKLLLNEESNRKLMSTPKIPTINSNTNESVFSSSRIQKDLYLMPPPLFTKGKNKMPHSGIFRTPTKLLICEVCKQKFRCVYEYTCHAMSHTQTETTNDDIFEK